MIFLDTNVVSETFRPNPSSMVTGWMRAQDASNIRLTAVTQAELLTGAARLPDGKRKRDLEFSIEKFLELFEGRILPFDGDSAREYSKIIARRTRLGQPISQFDAMLAAIANANDATVATRNIRDFANCGIKLVDPWKIPNR